MGNVLRKFLTFSFFGRSVGLLSDFVLVGFAATAFAFSFYSLASFPLIVFSVIGYLTSISTVLKKDLNLYKPIFIAVMFVSLLNSSSFFLSNPLNLGTLIFAFLILSLGFVYLKTNNQGKNIIWLNPLLAAFSGIVIIISALLSNYLSLNIFLVLISAFLLKPLVLISINKKNNFGVKEKFLSFMTLILIVLSLRHFLIISFRYFVPETELVNYSFNSRVLQSIFAIYAISLIAQEGLMNKILELKNFIASTCLFTVILLSTLFFETDPYRLKLLWILGLIFMCPYIVALDIFVFKNSIKNMSYVLFSFMNIAFIYFFTYFIWINKSMDNLILIVLAIFYVVFTRNFILRRC